MATKNYFINGITELLILSILNKQDSYVYEMAKAIERDSNNLLSISQNTIYTATYKLEKEHKISEYSKLVGRKRTRIYYHIEEEGCTFLKELKKNYLQMTAGITNIFHLLDESSQKGGTTNKME